MPTSDFSSSTYDPRQPFGRFLPAAWLRGAAIACARSILRAQPAA
jgi:hypothetical protein